eukprot:2748472-Pyramimonas_sp.AAC.1
MLHIRNDLNYSALRSRNTWPFKLPMRLNSSRPLQRKLPPHLKPVSSRTSPTSQPSSPNARTTLRTTSSPSNSASPPPKWSRRTSTTRWTRSRPPSPMQKLKFLRS